MIAPINSLYPNSTPYELIEFDLRDLEACNSLHRQRGAWQERSSIEALDEDHFALIIRPGALVQEAAA